MGEDELRAEEETFSLNCLLVMTDFSVMSNANIMRHAIATKARTVGWKTSVMLWSIFVVWMLKQKVGGCSDSFFTTLSFLATSSTLFLHEKRIIASELIRLYRWLALYIFPLFLSVGQ